jgi:hypothetical protein
MLRASPKHWWATSETTLTYTFIPDSRSGSRRLPAVGGPGESTVALLRRRGSAGMTFQCESCLFEFHGYHSQDWTALPVTLPSQWYSFQLVEHAMEHDAVVIMLRGRRHWEVAVPGLHRYPKAFTTNTVRSDSVSPGNLPPGAFDKVVRAVSS